MEINKREELALYQELRFEQTGKEPNSTGSLSEAEIKKLLEDLKSNSTYEDPSEPSDLKTILKLSDAKDIRLDVDDYEGRLLAALYARFAGCLLGVPVEGYSIERMEDIAKRGKMLFPPVDYWTLVEPAEQIQYGVDKRGNYSKGKIDAVLVDDDISYTVLNAILLDKYGFDFTTKDVAELWVDILPYACTAEDRALRALKEGVKPEEAAENNPYIEWIGAAIRSDAFAFACPGEPKRAAELAYKDAYLTHRRNGIYGEMFLAAAQAAAFATKDVIEALKIGMMYIPKQSRLYKDLVWAFKKAANLKDFKQARALIDERYPTMDSVHTNNNMIDIVFTTSLAGQDFTKAISIAVGMGLDNDCTAASIGSLYGANLGLKGISKHWYECFNNTIKTYIKGYERITFDELIKMFNQIRRNSNEKQ